MIPSGELDLDQDQAAAAAAMAVLVASGAGGSLGRRRSTCLRASFAVWADSAPASSVAMSQAAASGLGPPAGPGGAEPRPAILGPPPRVPVVDHYGRYPGRMTGPVSEGADLGKRGAAYRPKSGEDMFACGSVIQPSPKLLGLMEIHDRGSTAPG